MNKQKKIFPLIGTHMSIAGGLHKALLDGQSIGCTTIQIFVKNSRQWLSTTLTSEAITLFKEKKEETGIMVIAHAGYLINVASHSPEIEKKSIESLTQELERCDELGIEYLVLHPGSYTNDFKEDSLYRISKNINQIYTTKNYNCSILLETMAGQGSSIGSSFEELAHIIQHLIIPNKIGICLDTCHLFAAGYIFNTQNEYNNLINSLDHIIGLKFLKAIHINNSKTAHNSHVDRHDHLKTGLMPIEVFGYFISDEKLNHIPKILETPKESGLEKDQENLLILKSLYKYL